MQALQWTPRRPTRLLHALGEAQRARFEYGELGRPHPYTPLLNTRKIRVYVAGAIFDPTPSFDMGPPSAPPDIYGKSEEDSVKLMVEWFRANFEDPSCNTPRDSGEWVYIWGGPYDARETLEDIFGDVASETALEAAIIEVDGCGLEWARASDRMVEEPPELDGWRAQIFGCELDNLESGIAAGRFILCRANDLSRSWLGLGSPG